MAFAVICAVATTLNQRWVRESTHPDSLAINRLTSYCGMVHVVVYFLTNVWHHQATKVICWCFVLPSNATLLIQILRCAHCRPNQQDSIFLKIAKNQNFNNKANNRTKIWKQEVFLCGVKPNNHKLPRVAKFVSQTALETKHGDQLCIP